MREVTETQTFSVDADLVAAQFDSLDSETHRRALLEALRARDVYRKMIDELKEKVAKLEQGLIGPKSQRFKGESDAQLSLQLLAELLGKHAEADDTARQLAEELLARAESDAQLADDSGGGEDDGPGGDQPHRRQRKPTGRKTARQDVAKLRIEMLPDEVKRLGLDAFERIGEESATTLERRVSSLVEVTVVRPKFRAKTDDAAQAVRLSRQEQGSLATDEPQSWITIAPPLALPLPRTLVGPSLLANVIVRRFDDHLPYNRLENVYEREGMRLGRSTLYGWLDQLRPLFAPLLKAMLADAKTAPYVCTDATGVLVQAPEKCARGHFWVLVAPGRHVLFAFSMKHDKAAVDEFLGDYAGYVVADAHAVYDHLYGSGAATEVACWGHARAYFFKAVASEPAFAKSFLDNLRLLFLLERRFADKPRRERERMRTKQAAALVDRHFAFCRQHDSTALDGTPLRAAVTYSLNQESALRRFLGDGRLPLTNNISERSLRTQATGRKNWLFVGSDDGAAVNTTFTTLIASCRLNGIEPEGYLRDVLCLLPSWPVARVLDLAPCNWEHTRQQPDTQRLLDGCLIRSVMLDLDRVHPPAT